jgi:hypothetical protein
VMALLLEYGRPASLVMDVIKAPLAINIGNMKSDNSGIDNTGGSTPVSI